MTDTFTAVVHGRYDDARARLRTLLSDYRAMQILREQSQMLTEEQWMRTFLTPPPK